MLIFIIQRPANSQPVDSSKWQPFIRPTDDGELKLLLAHLVF